MGVCNKMDYTLLMKQLVGRQVGPQDNVPIDLDKITRHDVPITGLALSLKESYGSCRALVFLEGPNLVGTAKEWYSLDVARREYRELVEKFKQGRYKINVYDGKVVVTLLG